MQPAFHYIRAAVLFLAVLLVVTRARPFSSSTLGRPALLPHSSPRGPYNATLLIHRDLWATPKKRIARPALWEYKAKKDEEFLRYFDMPANDPASPDDAMASRHTNISSIENQYEKTVWDVEGKVKGMRNELDSLAPGLGTVQSGWHGIDWSIRGDEYEEDDVVAVDYPVWFSELYNPDHGAIVCLDNNNNNEYFKHEPEAPYDVKRLSDIMFLTWAELTKGDEAKQKGLRYVIRDNVVNHITVSFLNTATGLGPDSQGAKEVFEFIPDQDEFKALLGSPNGAGVAYLLIQHKAQLGIKTITKLGVLWDDGWWYMIWIIEDVPPADNS